MSIEPVLRWAANQVGAGARAVVVKGLRAGGPWQLRIDYGGTVLEAVLRVGGTSTRWPPLWSRPGPARTCSTTPKRLTTPLFRGWQDPDFHRLPA